MFDSIGRTNDDEARGRQAWSVGIVGATATSAFAIGWLIAWLAPTPAPFLEISDPVVERWPDEHPIEILQEDPPDAPPPAAPQGAGDPIEDPIDVPAVRPFDHQAPVATDPTEGSGEGDGEGEGTGPGGDGTSTQACPEGTVCDSKERQGGSRRVHHTELERVKGADPRYPAQAMNAGYDAVRCLADLSIDSRGQVYEVVVHEDCPNAFHKAVERALLTWKYRPVRTNTGKPVEARTRIAVSFKR